MGRVSTLTMPPSSLSKLTPLLLGDDGGEGGRGAILAWRMHEAHHATTVPFEVIHRADPTYMILDPGPECGT